MSQTSSLPSLVSDELPSLTSHTNSLAAAATMNAGLQREATNEDMSRHTSAFPNQQSSGSPKLDTMNSVERRRKSIAMSLNLNDPALPAPGEMQTSGTTDNRSTSRNFSIPQTRSPGSRSRSSSIANRHHIRQPSVGEVYQEMEQEQEAQVNRLLQTIRLQQQQLQALQSKIDPAHPHPHSDATSPTSERRPSFGLGTSHPPPLSPLMSASRSRRQSQSYASPHPARGGIQPGYQLSHFSPSEHESAILTPGLATPALPTPGSSVSGAVRDEVAFYQAECQNLSREVQMLKARIRELERQAASAPQSLPVNTSAPGLASQLSTEVSADESDDKVAVGGDR